MMAQRMRVQQDKWIRVYSRLVDLYLSEKHTPRRRMLPEEGGKGGIMPRWGKSGVLGRPDEARTDYVHRVHVKHQIYRSWKHG